MSLKQYMKMSKPALIRKITKALRVMPKAKLARLCYNITKSKLPRLADFDPKSRMSIKSAYQPQKQLIRRLYGADKAGRGGYYKLEKRRLPTEKYFSPKQLAAQRLFAKRARAGTLRKRRR